MANIEKNNETADQKSSTIEGNQTINIGGGPIGEDGRGLSAKQKWQVLRIVLYVVATIGLILWMIFIAHQIGTR